MQCKYYRTNSQTWEQDMSDGDMVQGMLIEYPQMQRLGDFKGIHGTTQLPMTITAFPRVQVDHASAYSHVVALLDTVSHISICRVALSGWYLLFNIPVV